MFDVLHGGFPGHVRLPDGRYHEKTDTIPAENTLHALLALLSWSCKFKGGYSLASLICPGLHLCMGMTSLYQDVIICYPKKMPK